jgi:hypothetical protein
VYGCLTGATYTMLADILAPTVSQDASTGQLEKVWSPAGTISCYAESIQTDAVSDASSGKKFQDEYTEYEFINVHSQVPFSKRTRIFNIRSAQSGAILWPQYERPAISMVFEVQGCIPILNPFGLVVEYKILAKKVEVQAQTISMDSNDVIPLSVGS